MYIVQVEKEEPICLPLNVGLQTAVKEFANQLIANPNANSVGLFDVLIEHGKANTKSVLALYEKDGGVGFQSLSSIDIG